MHKKTIWIFFGLVLFVALRINAQEFKVGLLTGLDVTHTRLTYNPEIENTSIIYSPMISFNVNGYAGYKSAGLLGISVEPGFIQKGVVTEDHIKFQYNYFQIPTLVDFYLSDKLFLSIGPEFAYMVNAKVKSDSQSNSQTELYNRFELSGMVGVNYNIFENFDIGLRYNHGLTHILKLNYEDIDGYPQVEIAEYNQYFQLIVRFKIKTGSNTSAKIIQSND